MVGLSKAIAVLQEAPPDGDLGVGHNLLAATLVGDLGRRGHAGGRGGGGNGGKQRVRGGRGGGRRRRGP